MLRALGSAVGVAISTAIQFAVMSSSLPASLPADLRTEILQGDWQIGDAAFLEWQDGILDAKMRGAHVVFIVFAPLIGICLLGCLLVKDKALKGDPKKDEVQEKKESSLAVDLEAAQLKVMPADREKSAIAEVQSMNKP